MPRHELIYIIPIILSEEEITQVKNGVNKLTQELGYKIIKEEFLGKKKMAYAVKKVRHGNYYSVIFEGEKDKLEKLRHGLNLQPSIIRHLITRFEGEKLKPIPSPREIKKVKTKLETISKTPETPAQPKVSWEDLSKKLDEILEGNIT